MRLLIHEHEPVEALELLGRDDVDLALTYDYNLAPAALDRTVEATPLWSRAVGLGGPGVATTASRGERRRGVRRVPRRTTGS